MKFTFVLFRFGRTRASDALHFFIQQIYRLRSETTTVLSIKSFSLLVRIKIALKNLFLMNQFWFA